MKRAEEDLAKEQAKVQEKINSIEEEKKRKLFDMKVKEMRSMFEEMDLNQLENLKIEGNVKETDEERIKLVEDGDGKGSEGNRESQKDDDQPTETDE